MRGSNILLPLLFVTFYATVPEIAFASVESTLAAIQAKLISTILPLCAILGIVCAAFSFFVGNPNAKAHVFLAAAGAAIGFGAPSIVALIRGVVQ